MITDTLREHCRRGDNGLAIYDAGWNDRVVAEVVAEKLAEPITKYHVAPEREINCGPLRKATKDKPAEKSIAEQIKALQATVERLIERVTVLGNTIKQGRLV